jgi:hypothetical protein
MKGHDSNSERILGTSSAADRDELAVELLDEFQRGRPIGELLPLLRSQDGNVVQVGIWIASELGASAKPLLADVVPLLGHARPAVRFFALDCVLVGASIADSSALASAVLLTDDPAPAVRWKALRFISSASTEQLQAARSQLESARGSSRHASGLKWLLGENAQIPSGVTAQLRSPDPLFRKYGVVAAARLAQTDREPLIEASKSGDSDVQHFAADVLSLT